MKKFTVYEIDYHDRCWTIGVFDTLQEAKKLGVFDKSCGFNRFAEL